MKQILFGGLIAALVFTGCLKRSDATPSEVNTFVSVLHLAPSAPPVEVYANNIKETTSMPVGSYFTYYLGLTPGVKSFQFKKTGSDSVVSNLSAALYDSLKFTTLVIYDNPSEPGKAATFKIDDDFSSLEESSSFFRFFNMSPNAGTVNFSIDSEKASTGRTNADIVGNQYYTLFQKHAPGTFTIKAQLASTDSVLAQTTGTFSGANAYTFFLKGVSGGTGDNALKLVALRAAY